MYGSSESCRIGSEAFDLRKDVAVADACETALHLLRGLIGTLETLESAPDAPGPCRDAISACAFVARQAAGAVAVMAAEVFPADQQERSSAG